MTHPTLQTKRLRLRPFEDKDLAPFLAYRRDPAVARFQNWGADFTEQQARDFLAWATSPEMGVAGGWVQLAIERQDTNEMIGDVAYSPFPEDQRQARIGYTLAHAHQGQGFASEAVRALLIYLFDYRGMHRIAADLDFENTPSARLLEKLGFRREAHFVQSYWDGAAYRDELYYGILKHEWKPG